MGFVINQLFKDISKVSKRKDKEPPYEIMVIITQRTFSLVPEVIKVRSMQRPGTEAIRTQIQSLKPKREITKIKNIKNIKRTYCQTTENIWSTE